MNKTQIQEKIDEINRAIESREEELYDVDHHEQEAILTEIRELEDERQEWEDQLI